MSHLTQPNRNGMEPVISRGLPSWRPIAEELMTDDELEYELRHFGYCHKNSYQSKTVGQWEAIHIFREDLPAICHSHIKAGDNVGYWKILLDKLQKQNHLKFQDLLKRAKDVPIEEVVRMAGHEIRMWFLNCPFHDDGSASLKIYPDTNTFHCFGCKAGSSTIDFVMMSNGCSLAQAVDYLT